MYKIIGADGREYGPVTLEQIRQWIAEGRANVETRVALEGSTDWRPLHSFPELSALLAGQAKPPAYTPSFIRAEPVRKTHSLALAGLILGIVSLTFGFCCCNGVPFNVLGIIFSAVALAQIRNNPELYDGQGLAIAGLALSIISFLLAVVLMLMFGTMRMWHGSYHEIHRL